MEQNYRRKTFTKIQDTNIKSKHSKNYFNPTKISLAQQNIVKKQHMFFFFPFLKNFIKGV